MKIKIYDDYYICLIGFGSDVISLVSPLKVTLNNFQLECKM